MRIAFSADRNGVIKVAYDPDSGKTGEYTTVYVPQPGEKHYTTDLPKELEGKSLHEIASSYRVSVSGGKPVFKPSPKK